MNAIYLLDTCTWLDIHLAPERLKPSVRKAISDAPALQLASISLVEVARKVSIGKLTLSLPISQWLELSTNPKWIKILPITPQIAVEATHLPQPFVNKLGKPHKDPADQLIVATARIHNLTLITSDKVILNYPHIKILNSRA